MYSIVAEESGLLPRERLLQKGAEVLSDQELLAIFLRTGLPGVNVSEMAGQLLKEFGSLYALMSADYISFCQKRRLELSKYAQLHAAA